MLENKNKRNRRGETGNHVVHRQCLLGFSTSTRLGKFKLNIKPLLVGFYCLIFPLIIQAQVFYDQSFRADAQLGLDLTYNFQFEAAHTHFSIMQSSYPDHPAPCFLLALNRWWQSYISTTEEYHPFIREKLSLALKLNKSLKEKSETKLEYVFFQYMSYAFLTRLFILRKEWLKAANHGRKALPHLKAGFSYVENAAEFYFSSGIYHYYAETYPQKHPVVRPFTIFFPGGDAEKGLEELHNAANIANFAQVEAQFYLGDIYLEEEKDLKQALALKENLARRYPGNTWFAFEYGRVLCMMDSVQAADKVLGEMKDHFEQIEKSESRHINSLESTHTAFVMSRVYHFLGKCSMDEGSPDSNEEALNLFRQSLNQIQLAHISDDPYQAANFYFMGLAYEALGQEEHARQVFREVLRSPANDPYAAKAKRKLNK